MTSRHLPLLMLLLAASAAHADGDLTRCRTLTDATSRLACYDALPLAQPAPGKATVAAAPSAQFGFATPAPDAATDFIDSHIPGRFEGWEPNSRFELANGQVWKIIDGSRGVYIFQDPKVRIRRGLFGAFYMDLEGHNKVAKVKRLR